MKYEHIILVSTLSILLGLFSCKKDNVNNPNDTEYTSDVEQFEAVWNGLNTSYVMWSIDSTDWDAVYFKYRPIFEETEYMPDAEWKSAWKALTSTLIDHHLIIRLERPSTKTKIELSPGMDEVLSRNHQHLPINTSQKLIMLTKLVEDGKMTGIQMDFSADTLLCSGILDEEIAYFYISSFGSLINSKESFNHFKQLVANEHIKSAIIDLRGNSGGIAHNTDHMASCFSSQSFTVGYNQTKTGLGRYDLGPKVPYTIGAGVVINNVMLEGQDRDIPIMIICDMFTASASEVATIALKNLPNCFMVGERTWGATCTLNPDFNLFYSGSFGDSQMNGNFWVGHGHYVYTPKYLFSGIDGTIYEGIGIAPDKECLFDKLAWNNGIDNQLECAIELAKEKMSH